MGQWRLPLIAFEAGPVCLVHDVVEEERDVGDVIGRRRDLLRGLEDEGRDHPLVGGSEAAPYRGGNRRAMHDVTRIRWDRTVRRDARGRGQHDVRWRLRARQVVLLLPGYGKEVRYELPQATLAALLFNKHQLVEG